MLYSKSKRRELKDSLFKNPTSEFRGAPFWAWNDKLDKDELLWQIEQFKKMGLGGFHMHCRCGMATPYLSDEFMDLIKSCTEKAKEEKMLAYLYDEDRWPSGAAGGIVTKDHNNRRKALIFSMKKYTPELSKTDGTFRQYCDIKLVTSYDIELNIDGTLKSYKQLKENEEAKHTRWYIYFGVAADNGWYNGQAYLDLMSKDAVKDFIEVTHERYYEVVGQDFSKTIPSIFTDEPNITIFWALTSGDSKSEDVTIPYTERFDKTYKERFNESIFDHLPELVWNLEGNKPSVARYRYHEHSSYLFEDAFAKQIGSWCRNHNLEFTGHYLEEPTLESQTKNVAETMRHYRHFDIPGIDMLCNFVELSTAKQCQSIVHQEGKEGMMSELYGVTGWEFDFRGYKFQGDWQAGLGVTLRVPHLSWYSMKGSAKRDYPACIFYQSAWYKEFKYLEDHFARVNTALTRGKPVVRIAVVHPIESFWLAYGSKKENAEKKVKLENDFKNIYTWLLEEELDFDFIDEASLPEQYKESKDKLLHVGKMNYDAVIVLGVDTLRSTTISALTNFAKRGGKVLFTGEKPPFADAMVSNKIDELFSIAEKIPFTGFDLSNALDAYREVEIRDQSGSRSKDYLYNLRQDNNARWLFIARFTKPAEIGYRATLSEEKCSHMQITVNGHVTPFVYDTLTGNIEAAKFKYFKDKTIIFKDMYASDSLLLKLEEKESECSSVDEKVRKVVKTIDFKDPVSYKLSECNVALLDIAKWSLDGTTYNEKEELLRLDTSLRKVFNYPLADGRDVQPWVIGDIKPDKKVYLKFEFDSNVVTPVELGYEEAISVKFNGVDIDVVKDGYYCDKKIYKMPLGKTKKGKNELLIVAPLGKRTSIEPYYLLGKFGVEVVATDITLTKLPKLVGFGNLVNQKLPFYGANIIYKMPIHLEKDSNIRIVSSLYSGALISASVDNKYLDKIVLPPYQSKEIRLSKGDHEVELTLYCTRLNTFGSLHNCYDDIYKGPNHWYNTGFGWCYEYDLHPSGIIKSPLIEILED